MKRKIKISDHSRIRYLQRVKGLDVKKLDEEILPKKVIDAMDELKVDSIKYSFPRYRLVIMNNILKSVVPKHNKRYKRRKRVSKCHYKINKLNEK